MKVSVKRRIVFAFLDLLNAVVSSVDLQFLNMEGGE